MPDTALSSPTTTRRIAGAAGLTYVIGAGVENMDVLGAPTPASSAADIREHYADQALGVVTTAAGAIALVAYCVLAVALFRLVREADRGGTRTALGGGGPGGRDRRARPGRGRARRVEHARGRRRRRALRPRRPLAVRAFVDARLISGVFVAMFLAGFGVAALRTRALPAPLAQAACVLAVPALLGPPAALTDSDALRAAAIVAFGGQSLWIFTTSLWLLLAEGVSRAELARRAAFLVLVVAAGLVGLAMLAAPGATDRFFAWDLAPEPLAAFAGGVYVGSAAVYAVALVRPWPEVRALVAGAVGALGVRVRRDARAPRRLRPRPVAGVGLARPVRGVLARHDRPADHGRAERRPRRRAAGALGPRGPGRGGGGVRRRGAGPMGRPGRPVRTRARSPCRPWAGASRARGSPSWRCSPAGPRRATAPRRRGCRRWRSSRCRPARCWPRCARAATWTAASPTRSCSGCSSPAAWPSCAPCAGRRSIQRSPALPVDRRHVGVAVALRRCPRPRSPRGPGRSARGRPPRRSPPGSAGASCPGSGRRRRPGRAPRRARPARRGALRRGDRSIALDDRQVGVEVLALEARLVAAEVVRGQVVERARPVRKPRPSGLYGDEADAELAAAWAGARSSGSRAQSEYSVCSAVIGWTACARRMVSGAASDRPR